MWSVFSKVNPLNWSVETIKHVFFALLAIILPAFAFFGLQPAKTADASNYPRLEIPTINLNTPVEPLTLTEDHQLIAPATIAGSFSQHAHKTLLIGHSSTVFANLKDLQSGDQLTYKGNTYQISEITEVEKAKINMTQILSASEYDTLILMTCAGRWLGGQDYSHRLIITATAS